MSSAADPFGVNPKITIASNPPRAAAAYAHAGTWVARRPARDPRLWGGPNALSSDRLRRQCCEPLRAANRDYRVRSGQGVDRP